MRVFYDVQSIAMERGQAAQCATTPCEAQPITTKREEVDLSTARRDRSSSSATVRHDSSQSKEHAIDQQKAQGVRFVADPRGEFTEAMGMTMEHQDNGLGRRSWRYSMLVNDGRIEKMFIEPDKPGDPFEVSDADTMYRYLKPNQQPTQTAVMLARHGCPHCARAQSLLKSHGIPFEALYLGDGLTMEGVRAASGKATVPQVFMGGRLIGGADQLEQYLQHQHAA